MSPHLKHRLGRLDAPRLILPPPESRLGGLPPPPVSRLDGRSPPPLSRLEGMPFRSFRRLLSAWSLGRAPSRRDTAPAEGQSRRQCPRSPQRKHVPGGGRRGTDCCGWRSVCTSVDSWMSPAAGPTAQPASCAASCPASLCARAMLRTSAKVSSSPLAAAFCSSLSRRVRLHPVTD